MNAMNVSEVRERIVRGEPGVLVDVRTPVEFREVHAAGAVNVPLDTVTPEQVRDAARGIEETPIYLLCRSGSRAKSACERLGARGMPNTIVVEGGTEAWIAAGLPVERGKKAVSLERQVRIAAGTLVFIGALLAAFVHPWFWSLPAFVGAGLVFAGVTDTCGMGMVLARMPWNKVNDSSCKV